MRSLLLKNRISSIQRLSYAGTNGTWGEINSDIACFLRPMTEQQAALNNYQWGRAFHVFVDDSVDLIEGDKIVINDVTYLVKGVSEYAAGREPFKKAAITLPEKS